MRAVLLSLILCAACHDHAQQPPPVAGTAPMQPHPQFAPRAMDPPPPAKPDDSLATEREEYITDAMAFTKLDRDTVIKNLDVNNVAMKNDWAAWEKKGPMTEDRMKQFYKQTQAYIWDLGAWHLWGMDKRQSDLAMVQQMKDLHAKTILDFGGGTGLNGMMMARAGFDVTVADLDSTTLAFAKYRADHHDVKMRFWKSDVEPMPPLPKYDVILCLDVLEHLPPKELQMNVDKLIQLKTPETKVIIHAPFGKTATHPMHLDLTEETKHQVMRLQTELPKT